MSRWSLAGALALVGLWALAARLPLTSPVLLPGPITVGRELVRLLAGDLLGDLAPTLARVLGGLVLGGTIGITGGMIIGTRPRLDRALALPVDLYRSLPAVALIPLLVVLFGIGERSKLLIASGAVFPIVLVNASYGVRAVRETRQRLIRSLGMSRWQALRLVILPESMPHVFAGLRVAASAATTVVVAAEMLVGTPHGLGRRIYDAQLLFRIPELYATVLVAGAVGYGLNRVVLLAERRALHWVGR